MSILDLIGASPGGLVYHLVTLFAALAIVGVAVDEWRGSAQPEWLRAAYGFGALLVTRLVLLIVGVSGAYGYLPLSGVMPPLERLLDLVALIFILYALIPRSHAAGRLTLSICLISLALAAIVYGILAPLWYSALVGAPGLHYNDHWQNLVWSVWQIALLLWGLVAARAGTTSDRRLLTAALSVLLVGQLLHLTLGSGPPHIAAWNRLASLIALPVLAASVYRAIVDALRVRAAESERDQRSVTGQLRDAQKLTEAVERIALASDLPTALQRATSSVVKINGATLCAVLLIRPDNPESIELSAIRRRDGGYETPGGTYELESLPALRHSLLRRKQVSVSGSEDESPAWQSLLTALGVGVDEGLTISPLTAGDETIGALVMGDAPSERNAPRVEGAGRILNEIIGATIARAMSAPPPGPDPSPTPRAVDAGSVAPFENAVEDAG